MTPAVSRLVLPGDDTPILRAAEMYAGLGFAVVPIHGITPSGVCTCGVAACHAAGKHPVLSEWQRRASADADVVRDLFRVHRGNIGIMLGHAYVAVDVDGVAGQASLAELGDLPPTLRSQSGSGAGSHILFAYAVHHDPEAVHNRRILPGIDIKTRQGQIVVAPSLHASGGRYTWTDPYQPAVLPDWLYDRMRRAVVPIARPSGAAPVGDVAKRARAYVARMPEAISGAAGHAATFNVANKLANGFPGLSDADAWDILVEYNQRCQPPWSDRELKHKLASARAHGRAEPVEDRERAKPVSGVWVAREATASEPEPQPAADPDAWRARLLYKPKRNGAGYDIVKDVANAITILRNDPKWAGKVRLDEHAQNVAITDPPWGDDEKPARQGAWWTDADTTRLKAWLRREWALDLSCTDLDNAVVVVAEGSPFHPTREWMQALRWDAGRRIDTWLSTYLGAPDNDYTRSVGRWWLISAVARTFAPGCKADHVLILEGAQGIRKSSALRVLAGDERFTDATIDLGNERDAELTILGKLIVELAELDALNRAEASRAKGFFTKQWPEFRPPYGRRVKKVARGCVFAGTVNLSTYLKDDTGNRRYWPVVCGKIDTDALARDREQIWAEAVAEYEGGAPWWPADRSLTLLCADEQEKRGETDEWVSLIERYATAERPTELTTAFVLERVIKLEAARWDRASQIRVGTCLRQLGWAPHRPWVDGRAGQRVYRLPSATSSI